MPVTVRLEDSDGRPISNCPSETATEHLLMFAPEGGVLQSTDLYGDTRVLVSELDLFISEAQVTVMAMPHDKRKADAQGLLDFLCEARKSDGASVSFVGD